MSSLFTVGRTQPSFFVIGFQKCGTTTLYDQLMKCPSIAPGLIKENNELSRKQPNMAKYKLAFPLKLGGRITGDASHLNTYSPFGVMNIKMHFPEAKLVAIVRNPVDRAFSHFNMDQKLGYIPKSWTFEQYVDMEVSLRSSLKDAEDPVEAFHHLRLFRNRYGWALTRGLYAQYLQPYVNEGFELRVLVLEEFQEHYQDVMLSLLKFLNISDPVPSYAISNKGDYKSSLDSDLRKRLEQFYQEPNKKLEALIGRKLPW